VLRAAGFGSLAGVLGVGALSGCDLDPDSSSTPQAVPSSDPDQDILDAARAELGGLLERLPKKGSTASLSAIHRQQLEALQGDPPTSVRRPHPPRAWIVKRERRAADRFDQWALDAENGDLARVLASVCAGIRMQPLLREAS
jgi:hypothetical protein